MKHKIITYTLISVFLFSVIGVPISLHYCDMMNLISLQSCGMCDLKTSTCCDDDNSNPIVKSENDVSCCTNKIIAASSNEKYLTVIYEVQKTEAKSFVFATPKQQYFTEELSNKTFSSDISPPLNYSNSIYLNNSILLI
ncbi:MAG TPA: hypothetical protein VF870_13530 [Ignavibacteriaceae bacterium]